MTIARGGVITGVVRDMRGRPVPGVNVRVLKLGYNAVTGERTLGAPSTGSAAITDDRGEYRAFGLPPGGYLVLVAPRLAVGAVQRGHSPADGGRGAAGVAGGSLRRLDRRGRRRAQPSLSSSSAARELRAGFSSRRDRHPRGGDDRSRRERGAHRRGYHDSARADGDHLGDDQRRRPAPFRQFLSVRLVPAGAQTEMLAGAGLRGLSTQPRADGTYMFAGVAPGTYTIKAIIGSGRGAAAQRTDAVGRGRRERERPGPRGAADAPARRRHQRARRLRGLAADARRAPDALVRARAAGIGRRGSVRAAAAASMRRDASRSRASRPTRISS